MDILPSDYKDITDNLSIGSVRKVPHLGCSTSNSLRIQNTVDGLKFYCFKCCEYCFESNYNSPAERLRRKKIYADQMKRRIEKDYSLPMDFTRTIPYKGLAWLGKGGWTTELIQRYNIGFSPYMNRVILPIVYKSIHQGYIARAVESWYQPKYLELCREGVMWESKAQIVYRSTRSCVITEDILSAGRCGEYMPAYALIGTTLDTACVVELMNYKEVLVWLDNDAGGKNGLLKIVPRLRTFTEVRIVESEVDPKLLTNTEIQEKLW